VHVIIYFCKYSEYETVFSRHFITGITTCNEIGSIPLSELKDILSNSDVEALVKQRELIVTRSDTLIKILEKTHTLISELSGNEYIIVKLT
jgi:hypothetical protein